MGAFGTNTPRKGFPLSVPWGFHQVLPFAHESVFTCPALPVGAGEVYGELDARGVALFFSWSRRGRAACFIAMETIEVLRSVGWQRWFTLLRRKLMANTRTLGHLGRR